MQSRLISLVLLLASGLSSFALQRTLTLSRTIPVKARFMSLDDLGNIYIVKDNNALVRYTAQGDSSTFYQAVQNGSIGSVDASNPLRVVVYYPSYSRIVLLDRMLTLKNELDLKKIGIINAPAVASGADGNFWVYDQFNARLRKIDEQLKTIGESNDLRQDAGAAPVPSFMIEREQKVFLCDTARGIFIFDRYGSYLSTMQIYGVSALQVYGAQLIYRRNNRLVSYNMEAVTNEEIELPAGPDEVIDAALFRSTVYVLYKDRLAIYHLSEY